MNFNDAVETCHVRSGIRMRSMPDLIFWKNNRLPLHDQVPESFQANKDWEEYDPRDHEKCSAFNELPA